MGTIIFPIVLGACNVTVITPHGAAIAPKCFAKVKMILNNHTHRASFFADVQSRIHMRTSWFRGEALLFSSEQYSVDLDTPHHTGLSNTYNHYLIYVLRSYVQFHTSAFQNQAIKSAGVCCTDLIGDMRFRASLRRENMDDIFGQLRSFQRWASDANVHVPLLIW